MKRNMPELIAIPIVVVVLGAVFVILLAADAGLGAWLVVGGIAVVAIVAVTVVAMRRPRGTFSSGGADVVARTASPAADGVHRVLLVSDDAYSTDELKGLAPDDGETETRFFVVAPVISSRLARWTGDERAYDEADEHLRSTVRALKELGFDATGHVGAHDPLQAADEALPEFPADEIVFALRGREETDWLERGVVDTARARFGVTVRELTTTTPAQPER
jgi:hypothetical protein